MEKQLAWAAASSSSGVVMRATPSVRAFQLRPAPWKTPLATLVFPCPLIESPCHSAVARLCMVRPSVVAPICLGRPSRATAARGQVHGRPESGLVADTAWRRLSARESPAVGVGPGDPSAARAPRRRPCR